MSASFCFEEGCSFLVSFTSQGEFVEATLIFRGEAWVAIGASPDSKMGQDAFAVISSFETTIESHVYHLNGREVDGVTEGWIAKAKVEKSSQEDGVTTLVVRFPYASRFLLSPAPAPGLSLLLTYGALPYSAFSTTPNSHFPPVHLFPCRDCSSTQCLLLHSSRSACGLLGSLQLYSFCQLLQRADHHLPRPAD